MSSRNSGWGPRAAKGIGVEPISFGSPRFVSAEAGGLLVTDATFGPDLRLPPHVHDRTCVATTIEGSFDSHMRGRSYWSSQSMVLTEPAGERHANRFGPRGARVVIVQPDAGRAELLRPGAGLLDSINQLLDPTVGVLARRLATELTQRDAAAPLALEGLALELLALTARLPHTGRSNSVPRWLCRVRDRLHDELGSTPTLQTLAALAGVHPAHLTRAFRRHFSRSIGEYLRDRRLEWAAGALAESDEPIADVATAAGFADQSHFTRRFRLRFGCTPARYRRSTRQP